MIPRTFPSVFGTAGETKMVVYVLPSITGLQAWKDYIPVKGVTSESNVLQNTYNNSGYQVMNALDSITGKQAWKDYIPVYEDAAYNKPWSTDAGGYIPGAGLFSVLGSLFANNEQGAWYDPSDISTLFQDSAGTTPVTAVEQPVGLVLDKRKGLVLGGELVTDPGFDDPAYWTVQTNWVVSDGKAVATAAPVANGVLRSNVVSAGKLYQVTYTVVVTSGSCRLESASMGYTGITRTTSGTYTELIRPTTGTTGNIAVAAVATFTGTVDNISVRELLGNHAYQSTSASRPVLSARVNQYVGTATLATQNTTTVATSYTLRFEGTGTITLSGTATGTYSAGSHTITCTAGTLTSTVSGTVTNADIRVANTGVNLPAYQRVNTATDYDTVGFPKYLKFDGVDDFLVTNSIDFSATDKMTVVAGVRKLVDPGATGTLCELSTNGPGNNGTFTLNAPQTTGQNYGVNVQATTANNGRTYGTYAAPITNVLATSLTTIATTSAEAISMKINGVSVAGTTAIQGTGTGNYGAYPLYIGRRGGTSLPFSGHLYGLIVRGAASSAFQISGSEKYMNGVTKAY